MNTIINKKLNSAVLLVLCLFILFTSACMAEVSGNSKSLRLDGVGNARELGGYRTEDGKTVKHGLLLRTARLKNATPEDIERLVSVYHLGMIVDFRNEDEVKRSLDPQIEGVEYQNIQIYENEDLGLKGAIDEMKDMRLQGLNVDKYTEATLFMKYGGFSDQFYVQMLSAKGCQDAYKRFFRTLVEMPDDRALLFHCSQGKDRTGCAAMLILFTLGVDKESVLEDFLLTNEYNAALIASERANLKENGVTDVEMDSYMRLLDEVYPELLNNAVQWMNETYGSPVGYITSELGVTEEEIQALRDKYLE